MGEKGACVIPYGIGLNNLDNTHRTGKYHCTAGLQFYLILFFQTRNNSKLLKNT